jgi:hypothetical protein
VEPAPPDPAQEPWFAATISELQALNRKAEEAFDAGSIEAAGELVTQGQPLSNRLLAVPRLTFPAMKAVSDLDYLYGQLLLRKRHDGWARLLFQKDVVRWRSWKPQTEETRAMLQRAEAAMAKADQSLSR